jgi:hypothetical protein
MTHKMTNWIRDDTHSKYIPFSKTQELTWNHIESMRTGKCSYCTSQAASDSWSGANHPSLLFCIADASRYELWLTNQTALWSRGKHHAKKDGPTVVRANSKPVRFVRAERAATSSLPKDWHQPKFSSSRLVSPVSCTVSVRWFFTPQTRLQSLAETCHATHGILFKC